MTIQVTRPFEGFPGEARGVKAVLVSGEVLCELIRMEGGGVNSPARVVWRVVDIQFDSADRERLGLDLGRDEKLRDRFMTWFKARHGLSVVEDLYYLATERNRKAEANG